ncbi:hypothetical protein [Streptomyces doebereineriae]|uniref:Uncharacterized protein n=1 Tax=Streptomyces doebereineriae TaxID=3075528 RepID=A0ABU2VBG1_9ACTN|nr:hypothetical protein [Streptomyces sp. DSM 41640]MDT0482897.1 hypothetical protein [Streptomyces sp. DSM 41640]
MSYFMYDVMGGTVDKPDPETMRRVLDGLAEADDEHPDVSLNHESGWCLSAFHGGLLVWENPDDDSPAPGEMHEVAHQEILRLFGLLAAGDIASVEALPWQNRTCPRRLGG